MSTTFFKVGLLVGGVLCLLLCAVLLIFSYMEYEDNAAKVRHANQMLQSHPLGGMLPQQQPGMPSSSKYAILGAVVLGLAGITVVASSLVWFIVTAVRSTGKPRPIPRVLPTEVQHPARRSSQNLIVGWKIID